MYQAITDHYCSITTPLWSENFMDLHLALFNLLMQSRREVALRALQLAMILLHNQEREELRRLLRFLKYAVDDDAVSLSATVSVSTELDVEIDYLLLTIKTVLLWYV